MYSISPFLKKNTTTGCIWPHQKTGTTKDVALLPRMWCTRTASDTKKRLKRVGGLAFNGQVSGDSPVPGVKIRSNLDRITMYTVSDCICILYFNHTYKCS